MCMQCAKNMQDPAARAKLALEMQKNLHLLAVKAGQSASGT